MTLCNGIVNHDLLHSILTAANAEAGFHKVVACFSGHDHIDHLETKDDIHYIELNSISNQWLGDGYECVRYSEEITEKHPYIKYVAPYKDPLYSIVTLESGRMTLKGVQSEFVGVSPKELGHSNIVSGRKVTPAISSRDLRF